MHSLVDDLSRRVRELEEENALLRQQQVEITKAKELYLKIFEDFPALVWRARTDKLCDYFNRTWLDFTGRTMEQEVGNGWTEGVHPDDVENCLELYLTSFDQREPFSNDYRLKNKFGEYRWIRDFGRPFFDIDNTFLGYIGSCYDITDNKNNELRLIELNATKDKFFSILAHDLRSPFNSILGFSEFLEEYHVDSDDPDLRKITRLLNTSARQVFSLLDDLLEWSWIQTDRIEFLPEIFNFQDTFKQLVGAYESLAMAKQIRLDYSALENFEIRADVNMVKTIFRNLLSNAIKFTNENGTVKVFAVRNADSVTFTVADSGIGIQPEYMGSLFNLNKMQASTGTANEKGTGLGLILCQEFVTRHGGTLHVESEPGRGSRFMFTLPQ
jgi:PAS domain S-box-containing protein